MYGDGRWGARLERGLLLGEKPVVRVIRMLLHLLGEVIRHARRHRVPGPFIVRVAKEVI